MLVYDFEGGKSCLFFRAHSWAEAYRRVAAIKVSLRILGGGFPALDELEQNAYHPSTLPQTVEDPRIQKILDEFPGSVAEAILHDEMTILFGPQYQRPVRDPRPPKI